MLSHGFPRPGQPCIATDTDSPAGTALPGVSSRPTSKVGVTSGSPYLCVSVMHHQAQAQPPYTYCFTSEPQQPPAAQWEEHRWKKPLHPCVRENPAPKQGELQAEPSHSTATPGNICWRTSFPKDRKGGAPGSTESCSFHSIHVVIRPPVNLWQLFNNRFLRKMCPNSTAATSWEGASAHRFLFSSAGNASLSITSNTCFPEPPNTAVQLHLLNSALKRSKHKKNREAKALKQRWDASWLLSCRLDVGLQQSSVPLTHDG